MYDADLIEIQMLTPYTGVQTVLVPAKLVDASRAAQVLWWKLLVATRKRSFYQRGQGVAWDRLDAITVALADVLSQTFGGDPEQWRRGAVEAQADADWLREHQKPGAA